MPKVNVVSGVHDISRMFQMEGWQVVDNAAEADLLQFPGGADVTPALYKHTKHPKTHCNPARDRVWQMIFNMALAAGKPMAGICGGGQFLNVMCGGQMIQDVDGHAIGKGHLAKDARTGEIFWVTSTHHQMMQPHKTDAELVMTAKEGKWAEKSINERIVGYGLSKYHDVEALWYAKQKCFCFQPHPEMTSENSELRRLYFDYLWEFFGLGTNRVIHGKSMPTIDVPFAVAEPGKPIVRVVPGL